MFPFDKFPYTNFQELNLDYLLKAFNQLYREVKDLAAKISQSVGISPYSSNPAALGVANPGNVDEYSRGNHVHPMPSATDVGAAKTDLSNANMGAGYNGYYLRVDGSGNISLVQLSTNNPKALGTVSPGISPLASRHDHVHPMPSAAEVGAIALPISPSSGDFLTWNGSAWVAAALPLYNGGVG